MNPMPNLLMVSILISLLLLLMVEVLGDFDHSIGYFPSNIAQGLQSIGVEPFLDDDAAKYAHKGSKGSQTLKLDIHPVIYKDEPLFGWFMVEVTIQNGGIRWFSLQAETKNANKHSLGEFFHAVFPSCGAGSSPQNINKSNFIPSLYAPNPSVTVPYGFVFKAGKSDKPSKLSVFWKMNMPICGIFNKKNHIVFRGYALTDDGQFLTAESPELHYKKFLYGGHDPKPPKNAGITCSTGTIPSWADGVSRAGNLDSFSPSCTEALKKKQGLRDHFYGRCNNFKRYHPNEFETYDCKGNNDFYARLPRQSVVMLERQHNYHDDPDFPNVTYCIGSGKSCGDAYAALNDKDKGYAVTSYVGLVVMGGRKFHGALMIIVTFFLIPVTNFITRYFKETYVTNRILHNHVWYFFHCAGVLNSGIWIGASMTSIYLSREALGTSFKRSSLIHRTMGWGVIGIFMLLVLLNGIRLHPLLCNLVCLCGHFFLGTLFYFGSVFLCATASYIPASPSGSRPLTSEIEGYIIFVILWLIFDITMHGVMMYFLDKFDFEMDMNSPRVYFFHRWLGFMFFPVLPIDAENDAPGTFYRHYMLVAYTAVAFLTTLIMVIYVINHPPDTYLGGMTFTHIAKDGTLKEPEWWQYRDEVLGYP